MYPTPNKHTHARARCHSHTGARLLTERTAHKQKQKPFYRREWQTIRLGIQERIVPRTQRRRCGMHDVLAQQFGISVKNVHSHCDDDDDSMAMT